MVYAAGVTAPEAHASSGWIVVRRCIISALAASGCYSPAPPNGVACDPAAPSCPRGQVCVSRGGSFTCGDPIDAPGEADSDGDGWADAVDNCPGKANPTQDNEDGDAFGDVCDPCPPVADSQPVVDADNDGLPDACDPRPTVAGDQIVWFEGFGGGIPLGWFHNSAWSAAAGTVAVDTAAADDVSVLSVPGPTSRHETVSASFTIATIPPGTHVSVGIVNAYNDTDDTGVYCHATLWARNDQPLVVNTLGSGGDLAQRAGFAMTAGAAYSLQMRRDDAAFTCAGQSGATAATTMPLTNNAAPPRHIGLRGSNVKATFAWLMVVGNP